jgi:hypothetical protein
VSKTSTQQELREDLISALCEELDLQGMPEVADAIAGTFFVDDADWLDKAKREVYTSINQALRKVSRLATRLDYLEKETNEL